MSFIDIFSGKKVPTLEKKIVLHGLKRDMLYYIFLVEMKILTTIRFCVIICQWNRTFCGAMLQRTINLQQFGEMFQQRHIIQDDTNSYTYSKTSKGTGIAVLYLKDLKLREKTLTPLQVHTAPSTGFTFSRFLCKPTISNNIELQNNTME